MHYVCVEDDVIVSILGYEPNVPSSVLVYTITDDEAKQIQDQTHLFDLNSNSVIRVAEELTAQKQKNLESANNREFLNSTDWKILRHLREKTLGLPTSLTDQEYIDLETQREDAASKIG